MAFRSNVLILVLTLCSIIYVFCLSIQKIMDFLFPRAHLPKVHMRSGTLKENVKYALSLGRAGRRFGRKGAATGFRLRMTLLSQHTRECQCAKTGAGLGEPLAAGQEKVLNPLRVIFHGINVLILD